MYISKADLKIKNGKAKLPKDLTILLDVVIDTKLAVNSDNCFLMHITPEAPRFSINGNYIYFEGLYSRWRIIRMFRKVFKNNRIKTVRIRYHNAKTIFLWEYPHTPDEVFKNDGYYNPEREGEVLKVGYCGNYIKEWCNCVGSYCGAGYKYEHKNMEFIQKLKAAKFF